MKGFLIAIGLILAAVFALLTSYPKIGEGILQDVKLQEKSREAMLEELVKNEVAFIAKYQPLLETRDKVAHWAFFLDEPYFLSVSKDSIALYAETPLEKVDAYGRLLYDRARILESVPQPLVYTEAFNLYVKYTQNFPSTKQAVLARNAVSRMVTKYGFPMP